MSESENKPKKAWKRMTCVRCPHCNQSSGWCAANRDRYREDAKMALQARDMMYDAKYDAEKEGDEK